MVLRLTKKLLAAFAVVTACLGCVSAGGGSEIGIAGVVLMSHLANSANNGDSSAKEAWCSTFKTIYSEVQLREQNGASIDDAKFSEDMVQTIHDQMGQHGYQLHRQQINMVIKDALNVIRSPEATKETLTKCETEAPG